MGGLVHPCKDTGKQVLWDLALFKGLPPLQMGGCSCLPTNLWLLTARASLVVQQAAPPWGCTPVRGAGKKQSGQPHGQVWTGRTPPKQPVHPSTPGSVGLTHPVALPLEGGAAT
jgi:hypothetical protein